MPPRAASSPPPGMSSQPGSVAALLDQLRASSAWQQLVAQPSPPPPPTVADLLAQLSVPPPDGVPSPTCAPPATIPYSSPPHPSARPNVHQGPHSDAISATVPVRNITFQAALPLLARLGHDPAFVDAIKRIKHDQDHLERQLWADREAIRAKYVDKLKVAKTRAAMVGANGLSKHEATMLQDAYQKEIRKFDKERVLPAWDGLMARQQGQLEMLGIPNMFVTSDPRETQRQKQIINVLLGLVGSA